MGHIMMKIGLAILLLALATSGAQASSCSGTTYATCPQSMGECTWTFTDTTKVCTCGTNPLEAADESACLSSTCEVGAVWGQDLTAAGTCAPDPNYDSCSPNTQQADCVERPAAS